MGPADWHDAQGRALMIRLEGPVQAVPAAGGSEPAASLLVLLNAGDGAVEFQPPAALGSLHLLLSSDEQAGPVEHGSPRRVAGKALEVLRGGGSR